MFNATHFKISRKIFIIAIIIAIFLFGICIFSILFLYKENQEKNKLFIMQNNKVSVDILNTNPKLLCIQQPYMSRETFNQRLKNEQIPFSASWFNYNYSENTTVIWVFDEKFQYKKYSLIWYDFDHKTSKRCFNVTEKSYLFFSPNKYLFNLGE